jgi:hypothetical protein
MRPAAPVFVLLSIATFACADSSSPPSGPPPAGSAGASGAGSGGRGGNGGAGAAGRAGSAGTGPGCTASPPPILPATLPNAEVGKPYSQRLSIVGAGSSEVSWRVQGELPQGISLMPDASGPSGSPPQAHAVLSGTPVMAGEFDFAVSVSLIVQPVMCGAPPGQRQYILVITDGSGAGAGQGGRGGRGGQGGGGQGGRAGGGQGGQGGQGGASWQCGTCTVTPNDGDYCEGEEPVLWDCGPGTNVPEVITACTTRTSAIVRFCCPSEFAPECP